MSFHPLNYYDNKLVPYLQDFIRGLLKDYQDPENELYGIYLKFNMTNEVSFSLYNREKKTGTIMLYRNYLNLMINKEYFSVDIFINKKKEKIKIPFQNIIMVAIPDAKFCLDLSKVIKNKTTTNKTAEVLDIL